MEASLASSQVSAIYYAIPESVIEFQFCPLSQTVEKIIDLNPELLIGQSKLFKYENKKLIASSPFQSLLKLLTELIDLDPMAFKAKSIDDFNAILQKTIRFGGIMRPQGSEIKDNKDDEVLQKNRPSLEKLLEKLGFLLPKSCNKQITADHCIVFGGDIHPMEKRIKETLNYLKNNLSISGHIFLLGSHRKLDEDEKQAIQDKLELLEESQRNYWNEIFANSEHYTEANAFLFLWEYLIPQDEQLNLKDKVIGINSTRIGNSYQENNGHRVTTEVTILDWMDFFNKEDKVQSVFVLTDQPFIRQLDQLQFLVVSNGTKASSQELNDRIEKTTFHFGYVAPDSPPLINTVLDELGRNVYKIRENLKYFESLK